MSILDIAKQRFSVRNYLDKEISQETLETILEAAHVAPTAANMQPVKLLVVKNDDTQSSCEPYRQAASRRCAEAARHPDGNRHRRLFPPQQSR